MNHPTKVGINKKQWHGESQIYEPVSLRQTHSAWGTRHAWFEMSQTMCTISSKPLPIVVQEVIFSFGESGKVGSLNTHTHPSTPPHIPHTPPHTHTVYNFYYMLTYCCWFTTSWRYHS